MESALICVEEGHEMDRLARLILEAPRAGKAEVEAYHSKLKEKIDSGQIIAVPGSFHRMLHEIMWVNGHEIYNQFNSFDDAVNHFCKNEQSAECNSVRSEEARFRVWYAETYLNIPSYDLRPEVRDWAKETRIEAEKAALGYFGRSLGEVVVNVA